MRSPDSVEAGNTEPGSGPEWTESSWASEMGEAHNMVLGSGFVAAGADSSGWQATGLGEDQLEAEGKNHHCKYNEENFDSECGSSSSVGNGNCCQVAQSGEVGNLRNYRLGMFGMRE